MQKIDVIGTLFAENQPNLALDTYQSIFILIPKGANNL